MSQVSNGCDSWTGVTVSHRFNSTLRLVSKTEIRTKDNLRAFERFFINAGVGYKVFPQWDIKVVAAYHHRKNNANGVFNAYRYHLGSEYTWLKGLFRIRWRERFQHTFALNDDEMVIRSRLRVDCNIASTKLTPYFSVETFNDLESDNCFRVERIRYSPGVKVKLSSIYSISLFYCRQDDRVRKSNIGGVEFFISI